MGWSKSRKSRATAPLSTTFRAPLGYRVLEQRMVFDGAAVDTAQAVAAPPPEPPQAEAPASESSQAPASSSGPAAQASPVQDDTAAQSPATDGAGPDGSDEATMPRIVVFVDTSVADYQQLVDGISPNAEVVLLDSNRDGVEQIAEALAGRTDIDAIHILSHGHAGKLILGNTVLDAGSMQAKHADEMAVIRAALSADADILIYGCDVAEGAAGREFVTQFSQLTGADVAASEDLTGAAAFGGDWNLEMQTGAIESAIAISERAQAEWAHLLVPPVIDLNSATTITAASVTNPGFTSDPFAPGGGWTRTSTNAIFTGINVLWADDLGPSSISQTITGWAGPGPNGSGQLIVSVAWNHAGNFATSLGVPATLDFSVGGVLYARVTTSSTNLATGTVSYFNGASGPTTTIAGNQGSSLVPGSDLVIDLPGGLANTAALTMLFNSNNGGSDFSVDNVRVNSFAEPTPGRNWTAAYTENGTPVSIADTDSMIIDTDSTNLQSATIVLTNEQAGDRFRIGGVAGTILANGSTGTINGLNYTVTDTGSSITIQLTGSATKAVYADTIESVFFESTSDNPTDTSRIVNVTVNDGASNSNTAVTTISVTPVNDTPSGVDVTLTATEDTAYTFTAADFGFTDGDGNALQSVIVTTLPANGTLSAGGVAVTIGRELTREEIATLTWTPAANANGNGLASFTFQVRDDGGSANGGVDTDQSANTITFNVTPVNDTPSGADATLTATEDTAYAFTAADFGFTDPVDGNAFGGVVISTLPANGTMLLNGAPVTAGTFVTAAQIAAGQFTWQAAANANGNGLASFTFQVRDDGGTANGGVDTDQSANTISFNVAAVNDAPAIDIDGSASAGFNRSINYAAGGVPINIFAASGGVIDVDSNIRSVGISLGNIADGDVVSIGDREFEYGVPTNSSGTAGGVSFSYIYLGGDSIVIALGDTSGISPSAASSFLRAIQYENVNINPPATPRIWSFSAVDATGTSSAVAVATININKAPVNTVPVQTVTEDGTLRLTGLSVADPVGSGTYGVTLSVPIGRGTLTADPAGDVTVTGSGTNSIVLSGSLADINAYLASATTQPVFQQAVADFNGVIALTMRTSDGVTGAALIDSDTRNITITAVADAVADVVGMNEDASPITFNVITGVGETSGADSFENAGRAITRINGLVFTPGVPITITGGSIMVAADGTVTFTPTANYNGTTTFNYTARTPRSTAGSRPRMSMAIR